MSNYDRKHPPHRGVEIKQISYSDLLHLVNLCPYLRYALQSGGGIGTSALDFLNTLRKRPPAVGVWHPDSFVNSLQMKLSCITSKFKARLPRYSVLGRALTLTIPVPDHMDSIGKHRSSSSSGIPHLGLNRYNLSSSKVYIMAHR